MVRQVSSIDRASALRSKVAKTCLMGLRSGEEAGRKKSFAPAARIAARNARPLWLPRLSANSTASSREIVQIAVFEAQVMACLWPTSWRKLLRQSPNGSLSGPRRSAA